MLKFIEKIWFNILNIISLKEKEVIKEDSKPLIKSTYYPHDYKKVK